MKKEYPKVNLDRVRGFPFVMVFLYAPDGTKIYTGDMQSIRNALRNGPTCHGVVLHYIRGVRVNSPVRVEIFGKGAYDFGKTNYLSMDHLSTHDATKAYAMMRTKALSPYLDERRKFILVEHFENQDHVLAKWRKLPKTYLPIFKEFDATG